MGYRPAGYLAKLNTDERQAWREACARIQEGRRGGISLGLAWCEIMRRGGDKVAQKKSCSTGMTANTIRKPAYSILIALQKALASAFAVSSILACCAVQSE